MKFKNVILFFMILALAGCGNKQSEKSLPKDKNAVIEEAKLISITHESGYTKVEISDPWNTGRVLHTYILVPDEETVPENLPQGTLVRTPVKNVLVYSAVHSSVLTELGAGNAIKGVCDAQYFNDSIIDSKIESGDIVDCGNSMQPTIEKVISMKPDAIMLSPYQDASYGQIAKLNVPIIECADYMEYTPLGRAEWIKFYGELVGQPQVADSIYKTVVNKYNKIKDRVSSTGETRPLVLTENIISGIWNVPGGKSYMAQFIKDAGGDYPWSDDSHTGSLTLDFNQVLAKAQQASIWLIKAPAIHSLSDLKNSYSLNDKFRAYELGNVYVCDTDNTHFFDRFPFHPELLLEEYYQIFHNGDNNSMNLQFFTKIQQ